MVTNTRFGLSLPVTVFFLVLIFSSQAFAQGVGPERTCDRGPRAGMDCFNDFECRACDGGFNNKDLCSSADDCLGICNAGFNRDGPCLNQEGCPAACSTGSLVGEECEDNDECGVNVCISGPNEGNPCSEATQAQDCGQFGNCGPDPICGGVGTCQEQGECFLEARCSGQGTIIPVPTQSTESVLLMISALAFLSLLFLRRFS